GLTAKQAAALRAAAEKYSARPYDLYFEWSDARIHCSELVWKAYRDALGLEVGDRQKLRDFDLSDAVVKAKMRERYGGKVPLDEPVISPAAIFDSRLLKTVRRDRS
ncbi:MAG TPA: YiiX/YebB-like N1pC/P60 family cysteine hydrolase, partial [Steroidobacteraceae bacterium]